MKQTKYQVVFYIPGIIVAETVTREYKKLPKPHEVEIPDNAYAFVIFRRTDIVEYGETFMGNAKQIGKTYYHSDSLVTNLKQTKQHKNATSTLIKNMEINGWNRVIWNRWGYWPQPYNANEIEILQRN